MSKRYADWTLIPWDGNTELGYMCWRKSFGRGHVSIGVGEFDLVVYNHGGEFRQVAFIYEISQGLRDAGHRRWGDENTRR